MMALLKRPFGWGLLTLISLMLPFAAAQQVQLEQRVFEIARQLRCPTCRSETAADSDATVSREFRAIVREQLEEGRSEEEILAYFQQRYGDYILRDPPRRGVFLYVWVLPVVGGVLGLGLLAYYLKRWTRSAALEDEVDEEDLERVRQELNRQREELGGTT